MPEVYKHITDTSYFVQGKHIVACQNCGKSETIYLSNGKDFIKKAHSRFVNKHRNCKSKV